MSRKSGKSNGRRKCRGANRKCLTRRSEKSRNARKSVKGMHLKKTERNKRQSRSDDSRSRR
jgi:hypothetical protein